ncbi:MAG TPA: pyruvate flavodoxin/ferredoxin oxidoreductase [Anaerolineae bacterium]|nr:pyruvate flavodoxin/ferredoxin oxidoreductase [Anaerolineae bacterium]
MREYTDGAAAIARGALHAGCDFFAGYPITPATPILLHMVRELPRVGGVAIQAEDEISSISMCIGAAMTGARVMTATSGPGISLYSENIGLAVMGEVPLVIVDVQRMGPATGGATTGAQGDVQFVRWGTSGGYPIIALCPSSVAECYTLTMKAFDFAERFRVPVFLLPDKEMVLSMATVDVEAYRPVPVRERRPALPLGENGYQPGELRPEETFLPYKFDPIDMPPPFSPFGGPHIVRFTTSSHDEHGFLTKDPVKVRRLNEHLGRKIEDHRDEIELARADLQEGADTLFVAYGTTARAMEEALWMVRQQGRRVSGLVVQSLWPVPEHAILAAAAGVTRIVVAELNLGQYRQEIERVIYRAAASVRRVPPQIVGLNRVDGELITPQQFVEKCLLTSNE